MKRCTKCARELPLEHFAKKKSNRDGLQSWCRLCCSVSHAAWRAGNADVLAEAKREKWSLNYSKPEGWYEEQLYRQGGGCAICGDPPKPDAKKRFHIDHDHSCCPGKRSCGRCVRALLCPGCNVRLSALENEDWMSRATAYLAAFKELAQ